VSAGPAAVRPALRRLRDGLSGLFAGSPAGAMALRTLVIAVADRCDQRCLHCQIWSARDRPAGLGTAERLAVADDAIACGVEQVLLTGGEPLLSHDLWPVANRLRAAGVRLMLATNGMLLERHAVPVARLFAEVYVSLDAATAPAHDRLRGVAAFERLARGIAALRGCSAAVGIVARCTLHAGNLGELPAIVATARGLGFDHCSFLALDASSSAFGGDAELRRRLVPSPAQVAAFLEGVERMAAGGLLDDGFVLEDAAKLRRIGRQLAASAGQGRHERPACDAPWWSAVVEADGSVRPCFFHEPVGDARVGLAALRRSPRYEAALELVRSPNPICERCVCPKKAARAGAAS
jgi:MoaA/NifB/PqqE/SkfB family radical SAM enzyme